MYKSKNFIDGSLAPLQIEISFILASLSFKFNLWLSLANCLKENY